MPKKLKRTTRPHNPTAEPKKGGHKKAPPIIDETLKPIVKDASTQQAQTTAVLEYLAKDSAKFKERTEAATDEAGNVMARLVGLEASLDKAELKPRVMAAMLGVLPKHPAKDKDGEAKESGEHRRADKRQSFFSLALEYYYDLGRGSRTYWTRAINRLKREKVPLENYSNVLKEKGGIERYGESQKKQKTASEEKADAPELTITLHPTMTATLTSVKDGDYVVGFGFSKKGSRIVGKLLIRDREVCNLMTRLAQLGRLQKTSGIDPKKLNLRLFKIPDPFDGLRSTPAATKPKPHRQLTPKSLADDEDWSIN